MLRRTTVALAAAAFPQLSYGKSPAKHHIFPPLEKGLCLGTDFALIDLFVSLTRRQSARAGFFAQEFVL